MWDEFVWLKAECCQWLLCAW